MLVIFKKQETSTPMTWEIVSQKEFTISMKFFSQNTYSNHSKNPLEELTSFLKKNLRFLHKQRSLKF